MRFIFCVQGRLKHAPLTGTAYSLEVAVAAGFSNSGYFAARFKEKFGVLPSEFLKALRQEKMPSKISVAVA
jgi:AraC-like DNA-binding protein